MKSLGKRVGVIRADELYTVNEIKLRLGVQEHGLRQMKRAGLKVIHFGRRNYVRGQSVLDFFERIEQHGKQGPACEAV